MHAYLNLGFKNQFFFCIIVSFSVNLCISGLQSSIEEISENCDFGQKCVVFHQKFVFFFRLKLFLIHSAIEC